jgi:ATP-binding cassette subfamily F protein uup
MSILLSLKNLNLRFGEKTIFNNAQLTIEKGDHIGLIGLNGQGKSTLFQIITQKLKPDISKPAFLYDKSNENFDIFHIPQELNIKDYTDLSIEQYYLAFYPKLYQLHNKMIEDYSNQAVLDEFERLGGWEIQNNYINYLKGFDLENLHREITNLSGGEKRKMALSIGLSSQAQFLLWDEPTNHLDIETIERFEDELLKSQKTFIIISHDRYLLNNTTNKIFHIERGEITSFSGTYLDYLEHLEQREAELQKNLDKLENKHRRELAWMQQGIKARGTRSKKRVEGFHNIREGIADLKARSRKVVDLNLLHSGRKSKILVELKNMSFSYEQKKIFEDVSLLLTKKDKVALIGPNGAGKSTLINLFRDRLQITDGKLKKAEDLKVVVFDQHRESLDESKTPMQVVGDGVDFVFFDDGRKQHVNSYLQKFLFNSDQVNRPISSLSGGEKNRLQLALFMKQSADLWVFDEPTNDLDIETIELLERELKSYDAAVIIIGHDRAFLDNTCRSTWLIHNHGIEVFEGGYTQVAPYLHAIELEKTIKTENPRPKKSKSKKEKTIDLEQIESEITALEERKQDIEQQLADFDYSNIKDLKDKLDRLEQKKSEIEAKIDELYQILEEI